MCDESLVCGQKGRNKVGVPFLQRRVFQQLNHYLCTDVLLFTGVPGSHAGSLAPMQACWLTVQSLFPLGSGWLILFSCCVLELSSSYSTSSTSSTKFSQLYLISGCVSLLLFPSFTKWSLSDDNWVRTNQWAYQNIIKDHFIGVFFFLIYVWSYPVSVSISVFRLSSLWFLVLQALPWEEWIPSHGMGLKWVKSLVSHFHSFFAASNTAHLVVCTKERWNVLLLG